MKVKFFSNFFRKTPKEIPLTLTELVNFLQISGVSEDKLSEATYFACLKILSETIGKLPLKLLRKNDSGGVVKEYAHPLYNIVGTRPNPYTTASIFWSTVEYNRNHFGNAFVWIQGYGKTTTLWILPHEDVEVWIDNAGIWGGDSALWYIYSHRGDGKIYKIPHDSILHFRTSATFDGVLGKPVRLMLDDTLQGNLIAQKMLNTAYSNSFSGKAVLQYTGDMSKENEKRLGEKFEAFLSGSTVKNIIPMPYGTQLVPVNSKLADNEFLGLKKYSALQIAAAFGIKPNQINDYEKASYASAEAQQLAFYVDTILFVIKQYEEELAAKLLSTKELERGYSFKFNVAVILRPNQKEQMESMKDAVQSSIYTPNEARAFLDMPSKPGGDELIVNGTMAKLTEVGAAYKKASDAAARKPTAE